jgi:hypothetical protein
MPPEKQPSRVIFVGNIPYGTFWLSPLSALSPLHSVADSVWRAFLEDKIIHALFSLPFGDAGGAGVFLFPFFLF